MTRSRSDRAARPRGRAALRWAKTVLAGAVIVMCTALLLVGTVVPRLTGAMPYTVLTGSMEPTYPPGTLLIVRPVDEDQIRLGTVITYQLHSGRSEVVTHRVIGTGVSSDGEQTFITQGDANGAPDAEPVRPVQVRGEVWYSVPYAGWIAQLVAGENRILLLQVISAGLFAYALWMFISGLIDLRRDRRSTAQAHRDAPEETL